MFKLEQLEEMFALQEQLEIHIGGVDWKEQGHDYPLCIMMECAEIINHYGWKHWKNTEQLPDNKAIMMEIVDIWHFIMAHMLMSDDPLDINKVYSLLIKAEHEADKDNVIYLALGLGFNVIVNRGVPLGNFIGLMKFVDMTFDMLYTMYISKNVLNFFRQNNGYKEGTYNKIWNGREDNEHLIEIVETLGDELNSERLYEALKFRYELN